MERGFKVGDRVSVAFDDEPTERWEAVILEPYGDGAYDWLVRDADPTETVFGLLDYPVFEDELILIETSNAVGNREAA